MQTDQIHELYEKITKSLIAKQLTITTMESCTSGLIASLITDTEGASAILKGAFITYSNEAKIRVGVSSEVIDKYGVYSPETAVEMATVSRKIHTADIGIGVTGSFGNADPANADSVPGSVDYAIDNNGIVSVCHLDIPIMESRFAYKLYVAEKIGNHLADILTSISRQ